MIKQIYVCDYCNEEFDLEEDYNKHIKDCFLHPDKYISIDRFSMFFDGNYCSIGDSLITLKVTKDDNNYFYHAYLDHDFICKETDLDKVILKYNNNPMNIELHYYSKNRLTSNEELFTKIKIEMVKAANLYFDKLISKCGEIKNYSENYFHK